MNFKITFLGTSNALPTKERNHSAILIATDTESILVDCGEGTQRQFRYASLNPCKLTKIFLTHLHGDHTLGLPGLIETLAMSSYIKTLSIYGPRGTKSHIEMLQKIYAPFHTRLSIAEISKDVVKTKSLVIESHPLEHGIPANGYSFIIPERVRLNKSKLKKLKLPNSPLIGELQRGKDITYKGKKIKAKDIVYKEPQKKVTVLMDTAYTEAAVKLARDADLLICEATYSHDEEQTAKEYKHLTTTQAATIAKKAKAKSLILTHISQRYEHQINKLQKEAQKIFRNTKIAKDLQSLEI